MDELAKKRVCAVCLAVALIAAIGASAWWVQAGQGTAPLTTVAEEPFALADRGGNRAGSREQSQEQPKEGQDAAAKDVAKDADQKKDEKAQDSAGPAQDGGAQQDEGEGTQADEGSPQPEAASEDAPEPDLASEPVAQEESAQAQPAPASVPTTLTVQVTVDGSAAGGGCWDTAVTLKPGATVYDALLASGAGVNARSTVYGTYVAAIDGLAEFDHGGMSGWVYAVNGTEPQTACSNYTLSDGDAVVWTYVNVEY